MPVLALVDVEDDEFDNDDDDVDDDALLLGFDVDVDFAFDDFESAAAAEAEAAVMLLVVVEFVPFDDVIDEFVGGDGGFQTLNGRDGSDGWRRAWGFSWWDGCGREGFCGRQ